jgi:hypothetical protein
LLQTLFFGSFFLRPAFESALEVNNRLDKIVLYKDEIFIKKFQDNFLPPAGKRKNYHLLDALKQFIAKHGGEMNSSICQKCVEKPQIKKL